MSNMWSNVEAKQLCSFGDVKLTVMDKVKTGSLLNAKVKIITKSDEDGQRELNIHKPSDKRHKAIIEIRKLTGFNYDNVEIMKDLITSMLDRFTSGDSISNFLLQAKNKTKPCTPLIKQPSLSIKLLSCSQCDYKSKTMIAL